MKTYQTRIMLTDKIESFLREWSELYGRIERKLYVDLEIKKKKLKDIKRFYIKEYQITARQFNSISSNVRGKISSLKEIRKDKEKDLKYKIRKEKEYIKDLEERKENYRLFLEKIDERNDRFREFVGEYRKLKFTLHQKKRKIRNLEHKLEKVRKEKDKVRICFGSKKLFKAQYYLKENGYKDHGEWLKDWREKRGSECTYIGSRDESYGNQSCQYEDGKLFIRVSDGMKDRYGKVIEIPEIDFNYGEENIRYNLEKEEGSRNVRGALTYRFKRKGEKWYVNVSVGKEREKEKVTSRYNGVIGIDYNVGFIQSEGIDSKGNPVGGKKIEVGKYNDSKERRLALLSEGLEEVFRYAREEGKSIIYEDLDFRGKKRELKRLGKGLVRRLSSFDYERYKELIESKGKKYGVEVEGVNPAYSSKVGEEKFSGRYGRSIHGGAAIEVGRRGLGYGEYGVS